MRFGFCFISHEAHIRHQLPIAAELSLISDHTVELLVTKPSCYEQIKLLLLQYPGNKCQLKLLRGTRFKTFIGKIKGRLYPNVKNVISNNKKLFLSFDVLITPHMNLHSVMKLDKQKSTQYICTFHGAGDNKIGFNKKFSDYDLLLTSGEDVNSRLIEENIVHSRNTSKIIGYPKYDFIENKQEPLFNNSNPIFVYNPHYADFGSSWEKFGLQILEFFSEHENYNLVLAPHIKLFNGKRPDYLDKYINLNNIIIDVESDKLMDATYTMNADVYIGDISSQIYEFLYFDLKPTIFLDSKNKRNWQTDPNFQMWKTGTVNKSATDFKNSVTNVFDNHHKYKHIQKNLISRKFCRSDTPSGLRGAEAILDFVG